MTESRSIRVLLVDDNPSVLRACARLLTKQGYAVTAVESAEAGLATLTGVTCDAILTDFMMPRMTGIDLLSKIRVRSPSIRRILMSTRDVPGIADYHATGLVHAFLTKPLDVACLVAALRPTDSSGSKNGH
jgi:CheY-like chemotaxis protein